MTVCGRGRRLASLAGLLIIVVASVAAVYAADISIDSASLSFDPNAKEWYVTSEVCNESESGYSGSLLYELRLLSGDRYWSIGSTKSLKSLNATNCREIEDLAIKVNTNVPRGTYRIQLVIGEYNGTSYVVRDTTTFNKTFIRGGGQP
ncbi:MAG: hypothetical protein NTY02_06055 [Acidobacteria bacterium]|nr:hypothetical protein [Acidobacteriota bacterium]